MRTHTKLITMNSLIIILFSGCDAVESVQSLPTITQAPATETPTQEPHTILEQSHLNQSADENQVGRVQIRSQDGMHMMYVPAGQFEMGTSDNELDLLMTACDQANGQGNDVNEQTTGAANQYIW